jgi:two-component system, cell cycle sensor histidine kinase and response regulator CckA
MMAPACSDERASSEQPMPDVERPRMILLIDDDDAMCALVARVMRRRGHSLLIARDACEAKSVTTLHDGPIDLILSDLNIPGSSGPKIVSEIMSRRTDLEGVPILFMSGIEPPSGQLLLEGCRAAFVEKPFSTAGLVTMVEEHFATTGARARH